MALNAYLQVVGQNQGKIVGGVTQAGREETIEVNAFSHAIAAPSDKKDAQSPLTITMDVDRSTPPLHQALVTNEPITEFRLDFWRPAPSGQEQQFYTIELVNARVAAIEAEMLNNRYPENMPLREREHVSFTYDTIIWTWQDGGITAQADAEF